MTSQNTFSIFKNKSPRFDWGVIVITGSVLVLLSFCVAWYFLAITKEESTPMISEANGSVELDRETFEQAEARIANRQENLTSILIGATEADTLGEEYLGNNGAVSMSEISGGAEEASIAIEEGVSGGDEAVENQERPEEVADETPVYLEDA